MNMRNLPGTCELCSNKGYVIHTTHTTKKERKKKEILVVGFVVVHTALSSVSSHAHNIHYMTDTCQTVTPI